MKIDLPDIVIDRDELLERIDDDWELLEELVDLFSEEANMMLGEIENAIQAANTEALFRAGHSMKSAVGNFAAKRVQHLAMELEMMGRNNQMNGAEEILQQLKVETAKANETLQIMVNEGN